MPEIQEPMFVQAFVPQSAIERFDVGVLVRLAGLEAFNEVFKVFKEAFKAFKGSDPLQGVQGVRSPERDT